MAPGVFARLHETHGQPLYVVFKHPRRAPGALSVLGTALRERWGDDARWHVFGNDSTLTLMQACVSKRRAVEHVRHALDPREEALTVGYGDTLSDVGFMTACDVVMTPASSQISRVLGGLHHVHD